MDIISKLRTLGYGGDATAEGILTSLPWQLNSTEWLIVYKSPSSWFVAYNPRSIRTNLIGEWAPNKCATSAKTLVEAAALMWLKLHGPAAGTEEEGR